MELDECHGVTEGWAETDGRRQESKRLADDQWLEEAWEGVVRTVVRNAERVGTAIPHAAGEGGAYDHVKPHHWVAGFWPGLLWQVYRETGRSELADLAASCGKRITETLGPFDLLHHDFGFMFSLSSVAEYKVTGDRDARRHGLMAASLLAGRFNPAGGFLRAWPDWDGEDHSGWAIIDCMMNVPLLYWASNEEGDPRFRHIATLHADTVMKTFFRPDGSTHHIVTFDPETGQRSGALGGQGDSPDSAWARGTAWALYGFALCHRYTGMPRFLHAAHAVADFFLAHMPEDGLPPWDFRPSPGAPPLKDSSAAACAASGLLELAAFTPGPRGAAYRDGAMQLLRALCERCAGWRDETNEGLLLHAAGHVPAGINLDVSLIYGDYFFAEAIVKLRGDRELFW